MPELELLNAIKVFGVEAVTGRKVLSAREIRNMLTAETVVNAYRGRENYRDEDGKQDWPGWAKDHPAASRLLDRAMIAAEREG